MWNVNNIEKKNRKREQKEILFLKEASEFLLLKLNPPEEIISGIDFSYTSGDSFNIFT